MINHHPDESLLLQLAAGSLSRGSAVVIATHLESCVRCRTEMHAYETVGGAFLESLDPTPLPASAIEATLSRLDRPAVESPPSLFSGTEGLRANLPPDASWPRALHGHKASKWRRLAPGVRWSRVTLANSRDTNVFMLRVAAGKSLPVHSHGGGELTQVLYGAFEDVDERYEQGDFEQADASVHHKPVVAPDGECICITAVEGRMEFDGALPRALASLLRL